MKIIRAAERHFTDYGWLKTFWLFSFSDYYDPENVRHGTLRVFNDDVVEPGEGFPTHSHKEMEIVSIVLSGEITHTDSMGNAHSLKAGEVQRMSAGTGITHSEHNRSTEPLHFYQIWIEPATKGLTPSYEQKVFKAEFSRDRLLPIVSGEGRGDGEAGGAGEGGGPLDIHSDTCIYISTLSAGSAIGFKADAERRVFVYIIAGEVLLNGETLKANDQARFKATGGDGGECDLELAISATEESSFVLIDLPVSD